MLKQGWLFRQLCGQTAEQVAETFTQEQWGGNPLEGMAPRAAKRNRRADQDLATHLVLGKGKEGTQRARNPFQNALSYKRLVDPTSSINCYTHMRTIVTQYGAAGRRDFSSAHHLSLAADGSRFSGRDLVSMLLVAHCKEAMGWKAMWLAPQVIFLKC